MRRTVLFIKNRIPKYLDYFERVPETNAAGGGRRTVGASLSYVDLSLSQTSDRVAAEPAVAAYLASPRRVPFNEHGIFRYYPELDP